MTSNENFLAFSKPFIDGAKNVFESMVHTKLLPGKPKIKTSSDLLSDLTSFINVSGELQGTPYQAIMVISWPYDSYIKMSSAMLQEEYLEYTNELKDIGSEICNMITGNAIRDLKGLGYSCGMAIPTTIEGKDHKLSYPRGTTIIYFPIESNHGNFVIEICYSESI